MISVHKKKARDLYSENVPKFRRIRHLIKGRDIFSVNKTKFADKATREVKKESQLANQFGIASLGP